MLARALVISPREGAPVAKQPPGYSCLRTSVNSPLREAYIATLAVSQASAL
jgi:hypothetical protein